jgi:hypothetical protein
VFCIFRNKLRSNVSGAKSNQNIAGMVPWFDFPVCTRIINSSVFLLIKLFFLKEKFGHLTREIEIAGLG